MPAPRLPGVALGAIGTDAVFACNARLASRSISAWATPVTRAGFSADHKCAFWTPTNP